MATVSPVGATSPPPAARLVGVGVRFGDRWAVRDVDLVVEPGQRVALVGPSGAGKTTLLSVISGAIEPDEGRVELLGSDLAGLAGRARRTVQSRVGMIHQQLNLVGPLRVVHNVNAGRLARWSLPRSLWSLLVPQGVDDARAALAQVGMAERLYDRTDQLSGGQQQRVALARVLVGDPSLILADEPISSLDPARAREVMDLLRDLVVASSPALVVSVHASEFALSHCQRVVGLRDGRVVFDQPAEAVGRAQLDDLYRIDGRFDGR